MSGPGFCLYQGQGCVNVRGRFLPASLARCNLGIGCGVCLLWQLAGFLVCQMWRPVGVWGLLVVASWGCSKYLFKLLMGVLGPVLFAACG
jgi:hypothetical protein